MGAAEILKILENGDELTSSEIIEKLGCSASSVKQAIARILKDISENLEFRILTPDEKMEKYGYKLGTRVRVYWIHK